MDAILAKRNMKGGMPFPEAASCYFLAAKSLRGNFTLLVPLSACKRHSVGRDDARLVAVKPRTVSSLPHVTLLFLHLRLPLATEPLADAYFPQYCTLYLHAALLQRHGHSGVRLIRSQ